MKTPRIRELCKLCNTRIVAIGTSRINGKPHHDWKDRSYHKKCWLIMQSKKDRMTDHVDPQLSLHVDAQ